MLNISSTIAHAQGGSSRPRQVAHCAHLFDYQVVLQSTLRRWPGWRL